MAQLTAFQDCDRFVVTLIDGDQALFLDAYIKEGGVGGDRAARDLRQAIFDYLKDRPDFQHDYSILIRIYLGLQGLSRTYSEAKIISNSKVLFDFVQAFNKSHDFVEIVDAGNDKEAADRKIQGKYKHPASTAWETDNASFFQTIPAQCPVQTHFACRLR